VAQVMRDDVATVGPDTDVRDAIAQMRKHKYGCLPVVDEDGDLVGIVTEADFLHLMQALLDRVESFDLASLRTLAGELRAQALAEQDAID
jgi:CBS domain-containing protein